MKKLLLILIFSLIALDVHAATYYALCFITWNTSIRKSKFKFLCFMKIFLIQSFNLLANIALPIIFCITRFLSWVLQQKVCSLVWKKLKIFNPIVVFNSIDMMNDLFFCKVSPNILFHYKTMFFNHIIFGLKRMFGRIYKNISISILPSSFEMPRFVAFNKLSIRVSHFCSFLFLCIITFLPLTVNATVFYVRPNGSNDTNCTGTTDADYPGSGTGQACAFSHPFYATGIDVNCGNKSWKLSGSDTLIIYPKTGGYSMGYQSPNTSGSASYPYDCHMTPIPTGTNSSNKIKIYGSNYASCSSISSATELYGIEDSDYIINLIGSSNVDLRCLHITDHSDCRFRSGLNDGDACVETYPGQNFAEIGLKSSGSSNINIQDVWITGMSSEGASISTPTDWTASNFNLWGNAGINLNFNGTGASGTTDQASGTISFTNGSVAWAGCTLVYPPTSSSYDGVTLYDPKRCCSQDQGCASDGLGTNSNQANWTLDGVNYMHNVADGLDLLYHDVDGGTGTVTVKNSKFLGNSGNQVKVGGNGIITNVALDANCNYFSGKSYTWEYSGNCRTWDSTNQSTCETGHSGCEWDAGTSHCLNFSDHCRAGGNAFSFAFQTGTDIYVEGATVVNTVTGEPFSITARNIANCAAGNLLVIKNGIFTTVNGLGWMNVDATCSSATVTQDHSVIYGFTTNPTGTGNVYTNPNLSGTINGSSANFLIPNTSSSAYDIADETASHQTSNDMFGYDRGAAWDAGAIEFGSTDTGGGGGGSGSSGISFGGARWTLGGGKIIKQ